LCQQHFFPFNWHVLGGLDADANLSAPNLKHGKHDFTSDHHAFTNLATQDQHETPSLICLRPFTASRFVHHCMEHANAGSHDSL
jgi:hypothetical protein